LFERVTARLTDLRAGRLGRFSGLAAEAIEDGDPLLGPARTWICTTSYVATRNLKKRDDPSAVIKTDVTAECHRRGLPTPEAIGVRDIEAGPRGGRPSATLQLSFANVVHGPILLGRDSHLGGGLFHAVDMGQQ
jgi:CRISPR-associated protein Csb2